MSNPSDKVKFCTLLRKPESYEKIIKNREITMPELPTSASVRFGVSMLAAEELAREGFFLRLRFLTRLK